ncbi:MAG TPA: hypothetical protein VHS36_07755 [Candidatus Limnocylindrales bacterium]|nr:hypothetical protein [Candidatus Limnocylindrales bacterium]
MTPTGPVRRGLQLASIATAAMALWLVWVVMTVLPSRDPGHLQLWAVVAGASAVLVGLSLGATRRAGATIHLLLALLSIVAIAFGLLVAVSFLTTTSSGDREGYLILIGAILTIHGILGLAWTALAVVRWRSSLSTTGRA